MKNIQFLLIIALFFLNIKYSICQISKSYNKELTQLNITNKPLDSIARKAINYLEQCNNYKANFNLLLEFFEKDSNQYFLLTYSCNSKVLLTDRTNPCGYINFMNRTIFVSSMDTLNFFTKTNFTKSYIINEELEYYFTESPTLWIYQYKNNMFDLIKIDNECIDKKFKLIKYN
ncbi:MAG: hypothetical protein WCK02_04420 [Bacteroidota bacterium]